MCRRCCKNYLYDIHDPALIKWKDSVGKYYPTNAIYPDNNGRAYFDFVNRWLFCPNSATTQIIRGDAELATKITVFTLTGGLKVRNTLAAYPWNSRIYYSAAVSGAANVAIRRVNYNGSGDVELISRGDGVNIATIRWISVSKTEEYVFYSESWSGHGNIRRMNYDGSGDTSIYTSDFAVPAMCVDNVNKQIYFTTDQLNILRTDFSGGGLTTVVNRDSSIPPLPATASNNYGISPIGWSHKKSRLFFQSRNPNSLSPDTRYAGLGVWSIKSDGSDLKAEIVDPNFMNQGTTPPVVDHNVQGLNMLIGDGFEKTGPGTLGS